LVDYILFFSAAIITASAVIMGSFLAQYRKLVREAESSTRLAKDIWDTANSRFSVVNARIIDLMAKIEVISERLGVSKPKPTPTVPSSPASLHTSQAPSRSASQLPSQPAPATSPSITSSAPQQSTSPSERAETKTEALVLGLLSAGPKSSATIKTQLNMSREHTARLMKGLFDRGLVVRNDRNKPYVYEITAAGRSHIAS